MIKSKVAFFKPRLSLEPGRSHGQVSADPAGLRGPSGGKGSRIPLSADGVVYGGYAEGGPADRMYG